jgi:hypothetical protein
MRRSPALRIAATAAVAAAMAGCGAQTHPAAPVKPRRAGAGIPASLRAGERPIGRGRRFNPPVTGTVPGSCRPTLGPRVAAHVELFGAGRVILIAAGIGTTPPRRSVAGRITSARCFGSLVTLDPTGTVYARPGQRLTLGDLFGAWGQRLSPTRIASFTGRRVRVYVDGHVRRGSPISVPLTEHAEIVLEVGPRVPPHRRFTFPPDPAAGTR